MATTSAEVVIKAAYTKTSFEREYTFGGLSNGDVSDHTAIRAAIQDINDSLLSGEAGGMSAFFISDDFDEATGSGYLASIASAKIITVEEDTIFEG